MADPEFFADTRAMGAVADDLARERPTLEANHSQVSSTPLPAAVFGRLIQSEHAAAVHTDKLGRIGSHLDKAIGDLDTLVAFTRKMKDDYEAAARDATERLQGPR
jgi:hypothetical protein